MTPKMCSQTKFGIPRIYATDTIFLDLMAAKDRQFDYYMPPFWGIQPVCHDRHKTVPEFIVILCDQMWMTII